MHFGKQDKTYSRPFTLIELLAVIGIILVLLLVSLPSYNKISKGYGAELAARNIMTKLNQARAYSISKRKYVAILFPQSGGFPAAANLPGNYFHSSYRACVVERNGSNYYFKEWIQGDPWEFLSTGVLVVEADDDNGVNNSAGKLVPSNGTITKISPSPLPGSPPNRGVDFSDIGGGASTTDVAGIIFKPTGASDAQRYIEIGEGTYNPGTSSIVMTNKGLSAFLTVTIDQHTGRISYGAD